MDIADALRIGTAFLKRLDIFLAANWQNLTCGQVYEIYRQFSNDLKDLKGNATGFTGLSEFLILRVLYHQLGGNFEKRAITQDVSEFVRNGYSIGQSIPIPLGEKQNCRPDIVLREGEDLIAAIQIKLYLTTGSTELKKREGNI